MSKRYPQPLFLKPKENKKPKLDFVNENKPSTSKVTVEQKKENKIGFWDEDDDDDEYIMLASQAIEAEALSQNVILNGSNTSYLERFGSELLFQSSTQHNVQVISNEDKDDEQRFTDLRNFSGMENLVLTNHSFNLTEPENRGINNKKSMLRITPGTSNPSISLHNNNNNKLTNSIETIRKDNKKLKEDYSNLSEKLQTKDGEVSMLRYELKQIKLQNDTLRLEKLQENENVKKEIMDKMKELERIIRSQQTELEFKNIEINNVKSKKINESHIDLDATRIEVARELNEYQSIFLQQMPTFFNNVKQIKINPDIFDDMDICATPKNGISNIKQPKDNQSHEHLKTLQMLLSQFQSSNDPNFLLEKIEMIFSIAQSYVMDLVKYSDELEFNKFRDTHSNTRAEIDFLCNTIKKNQIKEEKWNIYQKGKISKSEKAVISRRILAALSIICENSAEICHKIADKIITIDKSDGLKVEANCIQILTEALKTISFSFEVNDHFGLITAGATLLNSMAIYLKDDQSKHSLLTEFFKQIVFSRPKATTLCVLSEFLCKMCTTNNGFSRQICELNPANNLSSNEYYKILKFCPNSCVLQVYGGLLEVTIPQHEQLANDQVNLLTMLTLNTGKFLRNCIFHVVPWIITNKDNNDTIQKRCECYSRITSGYISLLHLCLKTWINNSKSIDSITISSISRTAAILLNDIFHIHYRKAIMQIGGFPLKLRLQIIYDWLKEYENYFSFQKAHVKALLSLDLRIIIDDPLKSDDDSIPSQLCTDLYDTIFDKFLEFNI